MSKKIKTEISTEYIHLQDDIFVIQIDAAFGKYAKKHKTITFEQGRVVVSGEYIKHLLGMKPIEQLGSIGVISSENVRFKTHEGLARKINKKVKKHKKFNKLYV